VIVSLTAFENGWLFHFYIIWSFISPRESTSEYVTWFCSKG